MNNMKINNLKSVFTVVLLEFLVLFAFGAVLLSCSENDDNAPLMTEFTLALKNTNRASYTAGNTIFKEDIVAIAIYEDKTQKDVTNDAVYTVSFPYNLIDGDNIITATYAEPSSKKTATLKIATLSPTENNASNTDNENEEKEDEKNDEYNAENGSAPSVSLLTADGSEILAMDKTLHHLLMESGIGYGYDVIKSPYYDSSEKTREMILDAEKLKIDFIVKVKNKENTLTGETTGSNQEEYINNNAKNMEIPVNLKIDGKKIPLFSNSLAFSFSDSEKSEITKKQHTLFYTFFDYRYPFYYQLIDIPLIDYLSEGFKNTVEGKNPSTKEYFEKEDWKSLAAYIFEHYGTHIITGVQYGGRYEYMYATASNDLQTLESIKSDLGVNFKLELNNIGKTDTNIKYKTEVYETLQHSDMFKTFTLKISGGSPYLDTSKITFDNTKSMQDGHSGWINSLSKEEVAVGLTNYGFTEIWNIIPETKNSKSIKEALKNLYNELAEKAYMQSIKM